MNAEQPTQRGGRPSARAGEDSPSRGLGKAAGHAAHLHAAVDALCEGEPTASTAARALMLAALVRGFADMPDLLSAAVVGRAREASTESLREMQATSTRELRRRGVGIGVDEDEDHDEGPP